MINNINNDETIYLKKSNAIYNIDENASLKIYLYLIDKDVDLTFNLNGKNSLLELHFSIIANKKCNCNITINHNADNTTSNIYNHGVNVLEDSLTFNICGKVLKESNNCVVNQENKIINLKNGTSKINPNLLIDNFNVSSSHSAYIGEFPEEEVFYLTSRGISKNKAINLLMKSLLLNNGDENNSEVKKFLENMKEVANG